LKGQEALQKHNQKDFCFLVTLLYHTNVLLSREQHENCKKSAKFMVYDSTDYSLLTL